MKKIIQIFIDHDRKYCLTEDGKAYYFRENVDIQVCDKDKYKEETEWEIKSLWEEIKEFKKKYTKAKQSEMIPF